jgi:hypothetical protein
MRLRNLWGRNWLDSPRVPLFLALFIFAGAVQIWPGADWSPILFGIFTPHRSTGVVTSVEVSHRLPSDGRVWEVRFTYPAAGTGFRHGISWAPTKDSKPAFFWKPVPRPVVGSTVEVEQIPLLHVVRIRDMRTGTASLDGALWLIFGESLFFGLVILGGRRAWRGNRLLVSGTLGRAKLERVQELHGRDRSYRMTYGLLDVDGPTFTLQVARREGLLGEGEWEWCLYEPDHPEKAVLLAELPALPLWARAVRDAPRG